MNKTADCIIFYRQKDKARVTFMQLRSCNNVFQVRIKTNKLRQLIAWCEDHVHCRRSLLLQVILMLFGPTGRKSKCSRINIFIVTKYFGEVFDGHCNNMCDNCSFKDRVSTKDYTSYTKQILNIGKNLCCLPVNHTSTV